MKDKIINILLIPFKVRYIYRKPFEWEGLRLLSNPRYILNINIGTILKPIWFEHPYLIYSNYATYKFKNLYKLYKDTKKYYEFIKNRPYNDGCNSDTVSFHQKLMSEV